LGASHAVIVSQIGTMNPPMAFTAGLAIAV